MNAITPVGVNASAFLDRGAVDAGVKQRTAADFLRHAGLPRAGVEAWKYTSLRALADVPFATAQRDVDGATVDTLLAEVETISGLGAGADRVVFVNGYFDAARSRLPKGVKVSTLAQSGAVQDDIDPVGDVTTALNTVMARDGLVLVVPDGVDAGCLLLASIGLTAEDAPVSFHPRHHIRVEKGGRLAVLDAAVGQGYYLHNPLYDIVVADDAYLSHARIQAEDRQALHLAVSHARIAAAGVYDSFTLTLGGSLSRHEVHAALTQAGGSVHVNGAQLLMGHQHGDLSSVITHAAPECISRQTVKNVLSDQARGVFQGKILVDRIAQKTDGYQMNQALLLSDGAEIDAKPELEIYADDVKCSHGATVGALDDDQLFYLRSRGISGEAARSILIRAFLHDVVDQIDDQRLKDSLNLAVEAWWKREAA
ncbi:Fe-S cluster assembly protein SufD [Komagataeibacter saccharivorans]|uniref:Fe-S cluster assembly protein SufD n=1 Tax=Komagataeibacter saccharivorans TaxID=265959 RepID=UPI000D7CFB29|nr:Fe-S cluster assembly protein SufD [Komagataeibacter saccharivorans]PYD51924.1 Fe-S cluster assembly protein SufD [Komagataeibacter saccharivorans]GBQ39047.1 iron-sulfur assembly protein SufD [Komagataeibacter saccharivorans NRIC 0614]